MWRGKKGCFQSRHERLALNKVGLPPIRDYAVPTSFSDRFFREKIK
jgi:hypothetical protein